MTTGFLGTRPLLPVLSDVGEHDLAVKHFQSRKFPSWGYEVEQGATTIWERWNSYTKENGFGGTQNAAMNSFAHYSFGAVCEWMFFRLAGIDTDGPGYQRIIIRPSPPAPGSNPAREPIHWVKAHYDSIHGRIVSNWRRTTTASNWRPRFRRTRRRRFTFPPPARRKSPKAANRWRRRRGEAAPHGKRPRRAGGGGRCVSFCFDGGKHQMKFNLISKFGSAAAPAAVRRALAPNPEAPGGPKRRAYSTRQAWAARARPSAPVAGALPIPTASFRLKSGRRAGKLPGLESTRRLPPPEKLKPCHFTNP